MTNTNSTPKRPKALHLFHTYLQPTENWAYKIINNLTGIDVSIGSKHFIPCSFYSDRFSYVKFPIQLDMNPRRLFWVRIFNAFALMCLRFYPWYIHRVSEKFDIMHSHFSFVGWEYRWLAKKARVPHIISFYGFDYEQIPNNTPVWKKRYKHLFRDADMFICEGQHGAKILNKIGCPKEKIAVAHLGVEVKNIPFWQREKNSGELNLVQIASLTEKKGHIYALSAFIKASKNCPDMTLTFVGGGSKEIKSELIKMIKGTPIEKKVVFIDSINFDQLSEFMKNYHVFIHPSCYAQDMDCEGGAPVVLLDAQATGMPVISTKHCDIPGEVIHNETGFLAPEKNPDALSRYIEQFYHMDQDEYNLFSKRARNHIQANFDIKTNAKKFKSIYFGLLNK